MSLSINFPKKFSLVFQQVQEKAGILSFDVAKEAATSPTNFERNLQFGSSGDDDDDSGQKTSDKTSNPDLPAEESLELDLD